MVNGQNVTVMAAFKPFIHMLTLYDSTNYRNLDRRTIIRHICQAITLSMISFALVIATVCNIWYCSNHQFNVTKIALPFALLIGVSQLSITFASIRIKSDLVVEVIDSLEAIILNREYPPTIYVPFQFIGKDLLDVMTN